MLKSKKITVDIRGYIRSVVELEDKILFANSPAIVIPKDMKYPVGKSTPASLQNFVKSILP